MRINTNIMAINAQNKLSFNQGKVESSIAKLSSGLRINSGADDAAGLAISEKMRSQIRGLDQAKANAQDGISMVQTAEGALQQTTDILQRMRELMVKGQNTGVLSTTDKNAINTELTALKTEITRIASSTTFNGTTLLNGGLSTDATAAKFKIGANTITDDILAITIGYMNATSLGVSDVSVDGGTTSLNSIDLAINLVSTQRASLGAVQNRMEYAIENLSTTSENLSAAESRIRDVDMAKEMVKYTNSNILNQSAMAMLSQANQQPQQILSLLR